MKSSDDLSFTEPHAALEYNPPQTTEQTAARTNTFDVFWCDAFES